MYVAYFERQLHQGLKPSKSMAKPHLRVMISHDLIRFIEIRTKNALDISVYGVDIPVVFCASIALNLPRFY